MMILLAIVNLSIVHCDDDYYDIDDDSICVTLILWQWPIVEVTWWTMYIIIELLQTMKKFY